MDSPLTETFKDVLKYLPARVVPSLTAFLGVIAFTRLLTPDQYGRYILTMTTISFASIAFGWINQSALRYFAAFKDNDFEEFISTTIITLLTLSLIITVIWYISTIIFNEFLDYRLIYLLRIAALVLLVQIGFNLTQTLLRADRKSLKYSLYTSLNVIIRLCLAVSLLYFLSLGPEGILWATALSTGVLFLFEFVHIYRKWGIKISSFSRKLLADFTSYGFPLIGISLGALIISTSDRYMIQYLVGAEEVGIYSSGYKIAQMSIECFSVLILASFPIVISTFEHEGDEKTACLLTGLVSIYLVLLTPVVFGITVLSEDFVNMLLGRAFHKAYIVIPWVTGGVFCLGLSQYFNKPFELKKKTYFLLCFLIISATINIGLNLYLIPKFGIRGAAFATLTAYLAYLAISWIVSRKMLSWKFPWNTCGKSMTASVVMYCFLSFFSDYFTNSFLVLLTKVIFGLLVYLSILFLLREKTSLKIFIYIKRYLTKNTSSGNAF